MRKEKTLLVLACGAAMTVLAACGSKQSEETVAVIDETHFDQLAAAPDGQGNAAGGIEVMMDPAGAPAGSNPAVFGDIAPDSASAPIQASTPAPAGERLAVRPGATFEEKVQNALRNAGFYSGEVDGKIGQKTREAIKAFQSANNLKVDGVVGTETWERLKPHQGSKS